MNIKHAFYSATAAKHNPIYVYETADKKLVSATYITEFKEQAEQNYVWPDKVYLGEVIKFVAELEPRWRF